MKGLKIGVKYRRTHGQRQDYEDARGELRDTVVFAGPHYFTAETESGFKETVTRADLLCGAARVVWCEQKGAYEKWLGPVRTGAMVEAAEKVEERVEAKVEVKAEKVTEQGNEEKGEDDMTGGKHIDSPEKARIREEIKAKGLAGKIGPEAVLKVPREQLEAAIGEGMSNDQMAERFEVSPTCISKLRKFYDLQGERGGDKRSKRVKGVADVKEASAGEAEPVDSTPVAETETVKETVKDALHEGWARCIECGKFGLDRLMVKDDVGPGWLCRECWGRKGRKTVIVEATPEPDALPIEEIPEYDGDSEDPEWLQDAVAAYEPPLLYVKDRAGAVETLVAGVSEYLHALGDCEVEVTVRVKRL